MRGDVRRMCLHNLHKMMIVDTEREEDTLYRERERKLEQMDIYVQN